MYELTRRWVREGHTVTVVTAPYEKSDIKADGFLSRKVVEGVNLIIINSSDSNRDPVWKRGYRALRFALVSCRIALTEPCDLVIASSGPITVGIPALIAKWLRGRKMVFEIRDLWPQGAIELGKISNPLAQRCALFFEKLCYRNSSLVVACSEGMEHSVKSRFHKVRTLVIPNASDPDLFRKSGRSNFKIPDALKDKSVFLYAGSLGFMDHGHLLIRAMKEIKNPRICLVILGDGAERSELESLSRKEQLTNVHFMGLLPKYEVADWLQISTATLVVFKNFPVLQTSSPNKMFDSFAAGVPVIHNTTGWIRNLVQKEECGIGVLPDDADALAQAIQKLANDPALRKHMALNAGRLADSLFNRDLLAEKYLSALVELNG